MESSHLNIEMCGLSRRKDIPHRRNHDAFTVMPEEGIMGVFDGIGSMPLSELISHFSARSLRVPLIRDLLKLNTGSKEVGNALHGVMLIIQSRVCEVYGDFYDVEDKKGGTTAEVAKQWMRYDGIPMVSIVHMGDSRSYLRRDGKLHRLTLDHNLPMENFSKYFGKTHLEEFQRLLDEGTELDMQRFVEQKLDCSFADFLLLVNCGASNILIRSILNRRNRYTVPDEVHLELKPEDELYLMTDGVSSNLRERQMATVLNSIESLRARIQRLIREARKVARRKANPPTDPDYRKIGPDDMTVTAMRITERAIERATGQSSLSAA